MFSASLELLGLAAIVAGVYVLAGLGFALLACGGCLLFVGSVTDDGAITQALKLHAARARTRVALVRQRRRKRASAQTT